MIIKVAQSKALFFLHSLVKAYPDAKIELNYDPKDHWQLLVVVSLSAQTTDKKVNQISPRLFERFKSVHDFAKADPLDIEPYIKTLGLYRNKAKNLVLAAQKIITDFKAEVPSSRSDLESLAGVGKKTAAVIIANAFAIPAIAVDTHVARVSQRLGLTNKTNPDLIEAELTALLPQNMLLQAHHTFIWHGRRICHARTPHCSICPVEKDCPKIAVIKSK